MWPDRVSNPVLLALESDALPTVLRGLVSYIIYRLNPNKCSCLFFESNTCINLHDKVAL